MIQIPPSFIEPQNINNWLNDIFNSQYGLPCVCGDQTEGGELYVARPHIISICQRSNSPCMVEVKFHLGTANGIWNFNRNLSGFSLNTTDGINGDWFQLRPEIGDSSHNPSLNNTSLAGTESVDATWDFALYNPSNPNHVSSDLCTVNYGSLGIPVHTFVFDMCSHVSSWLSEPSVSFRITFSKVVDINSQPAGCITVNRNGF